ncbi:SDR family NAD(P)-dependent oxidoreductase [Aquirhabdus parva]|uniref:SDR family NAD(P)-dependent oxidoreductase n=1 Tax=Aquirhabdus parva TaxID=2283318 RepID=A0A345P9I5_9GAMM|nr:SDR family NAD(P)-dependent oxidoreductase [Aquirhabdus parva]AXI03944.1 SDR family NAD(P)-dependent oxidoreductase [Aquirhabdus parva]
MSRISDLLRPSRKQRLLGQVVVVTGAGSGFGREASLLFASLGANVVAVDINLPAAEETAQLARALGIKADAHKVDVGNVEQMEALATWVAEVYGAPDVIINNAGIGMAGSFLETTVQDWNRVMNVNLWGVIHGSRLFAKQMVAAKKAGHIVNVASMAAFTPSRTTAAYSTTKAAVRMFSDCIRGELADYSIGVSTICPGFSTTGIVNNTRFAGLSEAEQAKTRAKANKLYSLRSLPPRVIAEAILHAVEHNEPEVPVGFEATGMRLLGRISPGFSRLFARLDITP